MKKTLILVLVFFLSIVNVSAQNNDAETQVIKKKIIKSNESIKHPKKQLKSITWSNRAKIFIEAYSINFKYLSQGLATSSIPLLGISETSPNPFYGKPLSKTKEDNYEVWNYKKLKIFTQNGVVDFWEDLEPVDTQALDKALEAINKAVELDEKGKFISKKSTITQIASIREFLLNSAIKAYNKNDYPVALENIEKGIELFKFPREGNDTLVPNGAYYYYAGIFAFGAEDFTKSKKYFKQSLDEEYEVGTSYQYLVEAMYKLNDSVAAVKLLEEGAAKYPQETKIIYSLIDYYTPRGVYDKAFQYIDKAIDMTPEKSILYIVKGSSYQKIYESVQKKYFSNLFIADSLDKEAFKFRNNPARQKGIVEQEKEILDNKIPVLEKDLKIYKQNVLDEYTLGISKDIENSDYYYTVSYFYYTLAVRNIKASSSMRKLKDIIKMLDDEAVESMKKAQEYGEKAHELNETDLFAMELLSKIYYRQRMYDKSSEMKQLIKDQKNK